MIQIDRDRPMPPAPRLTRSEAIAAGKAAAKARREAGEPEPVKAPVDPARSAKMKRGKAAARARRAWAELREAHQARDAEWYHAALADLRAAVQRAADVAAGG